ncbi:lipid II:glycine glycyltransferase FemX [Halopelagius longus]|uniref:Acetyltransferase (GNAT) domain-containing protein n=1 Tax=Halopelagius longus TaxID=1236180 RepID=A0A1H1GIX4_9EURY|nr:GNAT family N-acetyltransferase [Halopelagius longus]RDI69711.1 GNAT family N-acetyltransferase [Halopelagius longus]SDR13184.1 Acetyltransferase (GNAT) domain-containing protein [Halopelagius longus]
MSIEIEEIGRDEYGTWDSYVEQSPNSNLFHQSKALELQSEFSGAELHALVGYKGQEPVGLFPLFEMEKGPFTAVFSPPPKLWIPRQGPALLNMQKLKRRKQERRLKRFIDGCVEWLDENVDHDYAEIRTAGDYHDARPFKWNGSEVTPEYTYVVDLTVGEDDLLGQFSSDARSNIRNTDEDSYTVEEGTVEDVDRILEQVRDRYEAQGKAFNMVRGFGRSLYEALPEGQIRPYVCRSDGEYLTGILAFEYDGRTHRWQGGVKPDFDVDIPTNDLLDWHIMSDAMDRGLDQYDLVGAGNPRLNEYKSKFGPELELFYDIEHGSRPATVLVDLYRRFA